MIIFLAFIFPTVFVAYFSAYKKLTIWISLLINFFAYFLFVFWSSTNTPDPVTTWVMFFFLILPISIVHTFFYALTKTIKGW